MSNNPLRLIAARIVGACSTDVPQDEKITYVAEQIATLAAPQPSEAGLPVDDRASSQYLLRTSAKDLHKVAEYLEAVAQSAALSAPSQMEALTEALSELEWYGHTIAGGAPMLNNGYDRVARQSEKRWYDVTLPLINRIKKARQPAPAEHCSCWTDTDGDHHTEACAIHAPAEPPKEVHYRCQGCGRYFDEKITSHARSEDDGHGNEIPVECGPVVPETTPGGEG